MWNKENHSSCLPLALLLPVSLHGLWLAVTCAHHPSPANEQAEQCSIPLSIQCHSAVLQLTLHGTPYSLPHEGGTRLGISPATAELPPSPAHRRLPSSFILPCDGVGGGSSSRPLEPLALLQPYCPYSLPHSSETVFLAAPAQLLLFR